MPKILVLFCAIGAACGGCNKPGSLEETSGPKRPLPPSTSPNVLRVHWLGKKAISAETNAAGFMKIWNLPESARLEAQTLDKLALALGNQLPLTNSPSPITNYQSYLGGPSALIRPLLAGLLQEEFYFEMRQPTNQPWAFVLAVRLDEASAGVWRTNLALALQALAGKRLVSAAKPNGWQIEINDLRPLLKILHSGSGLSTPQPASLELTRAGEWSIVGLAVKGETQESASNPFVSEIRRGIESSGTRAPFHSTGTNFWLEAELDLAALAPPFLTNLTKSENLPRIAINLIGDGENVRTRGHLDFPKRLPYLAEA